MERVVKLRNLLLLLKITVLLLFTSQMTYAFQEGVSFTELKILPSDGAEGDQFGIVSISGDYAVVGAYLDDDNGADSGSAYIYKKYITPTYLYDLLLGE